LIEHALLHAGAEVFVSKYGSRIWAQVNPTIWSLHFAASSA
jgi:hypothetical protein